MAGLVLTIAPGETFIVNGAVLENGDKPCRIRVVDSDARVLRGSDALRPDEVDTPVKQVYYAIQLLITGDLTEKLALSAIVAECRKLEDVFETVNPDVIPTLQTMVLRGNYYSALCYLKQVIALEAEILAYGERNQSHTLEVKVA